MSKGGIVVRLPKAEIPNATVEHFNEVSSQEILPILLRIEKLLIEIKESIKADN